MARLASAADRLVFEADNGAPVVAGVTVGALVVGEHMVNRFACSIDDAVVAMAGLTLAGRALE